MRLAKFLRARWGWLLLLALLAASAGGYEFYRRQQAEHARLSAIESLRTEVVGRGSIRAVVSATGSILPESQANLAFLLPGTVSQVLVESGDVVRAGQVLAVLDSTELQLAVQQARDALAVAEINRQQLLAGPSDDDVAAASANLRAARANSADAQRGAGTEEVSIAQLRYDSLQADYQALADQYNNLVQFARDNPAFAPPQDTLDTLKSRMESAYFAAEIGRLQLEQIKAGNRGPASVASAQVVQAQAVLSQTLAAPGDLQVAQADLAVQQAAAALERALLRLSYTELTAPFDGVVATVGVRAGEPALAATSAAFVLLDTTRFHLDVTVDEVDVARLSLGQPVAIRVDALAGTPLSGQVDRLAPVAAATGGLVNYAVRLALDATEAPLRAGMSATAEIAVAEIDDALLLPNWAIRRDRRTGQAYASIQVGETLVERAIVTGLRGDTYTEVLEGVQAGEVAAVSSTREGFNLLGDN